MKPIHKKLYEQLDIIQKFYSEKGIKLTATAGTLLGAIREKGIIEWDDDIDLQIVEEQEKDFLEHVKELESQFGWKCYFHDPINGYKFRDQEGNDIPVDIFVLRPTKEKLSFFTKFKINLMLVKIVKMSSVKSFRSTKHKIITILIKPFAHLFIWGKRSYKDIEKAMRNDGSSTYAELSSPIIRNKTLISVEDTKEIIETKFGPTKIYVIKNNEEKLKREYGDWRTPKVWADHGNE